MATLGGIPDENAPTFNEDSVNIASWPKTAFRSAAGVAESFITLHPNCVGFTIKVLPTLVDGVTDNNPLIISLKSGEVAKVDAGLVGGEQIDILFPGDAVSFAADRFRNSNPNPGEGKGAGPERTQEGPTKLYTAIIETNANGAQLAGGGAPAEGIAYKGASGPGVGNEEVNESITSISAGATAGQIVVTLDGTPSIPAFTPGMVLDITGTGVYDGRLEVVATDDGADTVTVLADFRGDRTGDAVLYSPGDDDGISGTSAATHCEFILIQELHALDDQILREEY